MTVICLGYNINRNILECKGRLRGFSYLLQIVLIETYWNVKRNGKPRN